MAISRMQMNRQLRAGGGIMDVAPREKFGLGSSLKKFVRKVIPNEVADVATKAAPFVAPFNPLLAAGMAGIGGFDQTGSISKSLRSGALTYGLGNLARVVGGAGFQAGLKAPGTGTGFGSYFTSPMSGQQLFGATPEPTSVIKPDAGIDQYADIEQMLYKTDPSKLTLGQQADIVAQQVSTGTPKTGYKDILGKIVGKDATFGERTQAIKELGGKAIKDIYTTDKGKVDKLAVAATIAGAGSYLEAKKLAEEAELVEDADDYTEEMYEADKAAYADKYSQYLTPEAFGLKEGGRVKLEGGGIPSIMLEEKDDYNFMELIDEKGEDEYYKKKAEELDRKYNPQNYNNIIPKEKPMDQYMLNEVMSEKGMNTLSEEARDDAMKMYAERAYKKGQISEDEYREIMGFKVGGRVGYKGGTDNPFLKIIDKVAPEEDPFQKLITKISPLFIDEKGDYREGLQKAKFALSKFLTGTGTDLDTGTEWYNKLDDETQKDIIKEKIKYRDQGYIGGTPVYDEEFAGRYGIGGNYASGGRVGYKDAGFTTVEDLGIEKEEIEPRFQYDLKDLDIERDKSKVLVMDKDGSTKIMDKEIAETLGLKIIADSFDTELMKKTEDIYKKTGDPIIDRLMFLPKTLDKVSEKIAPMLGYDLEKKAEGGIMGVRNKYAMGSEVPIRENQAGIREMDFRQTGGFVPPIGVKEKADDIPAMLSNNEFVFTADAVRAAGGGSVNKGAQKMYNLMKSLENKVV